MSSPNPPLGQKSPEICRPMGQGAQSRCCPASPSSAGTPCWCRGSSAGPGAARELPGTEGSRHRTWTRTPPAAARTPPGSTRILSRCPGTSGTKRGIQMKTGSAREKKKLNCLGLCFVPCDQCHTTALLRICKDLLQFCSPPPYRGKCLLFFFPQGFQKRTVNERDRQEKRILFPLKKNKNTSHSFF